MEDLVSRHGALGMARRAALVLSCLTLASGACAAVGIAGAGASTVPASADADAQTAESPAALARVLPAADAPDLGTHGTLTLHPTPSGPSRVAQPAAGQPLVPCNVGLLAYNTGGATARVAYARGTITCHGAGVVVKIEPTFDWFNTPLFSAFRHAPQPAMNRSFNVPYYATDSTNAGVPKARVVRLCVGVSAPGYSSAFGCYYAPFGPGDPFGTGV